MFQLQYFINIIGGRKVFFGLILILLSTIIDLHTSKGLSDNLQFLFLSVYGFFVGGNVGAKALNKAEQKNKEWLYIIH